MDDQEATSSDAESPDQGREGREPQDPGPVAGPDIPSVRQIDSSFVPELVRNVSAALKTAGARPLLVGGCVRDQILGIPAKDFDLEIYGLDESRLIDALSAFGEVNLVGRSFGVYVLSVGGESIDIAMPRREKKIGEGHRGFEVISDPHMGLSEASRRRDFTINALAMDPVTGEIYDPHGGLADIERRVLRATDPKAFVEDPLRVLRGAQFSARLGLVVDPETMAGMNQVRGELASLPADRVGKEWEKILLKGQYPSRGMEVMKWAGVLSVLHPELDRLSETPQDPEHHPEGDVWTHTKMVVDRARELSVDLLPEQREAIMYAALFHDISKPEVTRTDESGRVVSPGHESLGADRFPDIARNQLRLPNRVIDRVVPLIREHMTPHLIYRDRDRVGDAAVRRLARRLQPATVEELARLAEADKTGRGPLGPQTSPASQWLVDRARQLNVSAAPEGPLIQGRDLIRLGVRPGPEIGRLLARLQEMQTQGEIRTAEEAMAAAKILIGG